MSLTSSTGITRGLATEDKDEAMRRRNASFGAMAAYFLMVGANILSLDQRLGLGLGLGVRKCVECERRHDHVKIKVSRNRTVKTSLCILLLLFIYFNTKHNETTTRTTL